MNMTYCNFCNEFARLPCNSIITKEQYKKFSIEELISDIRFHESKRQLNYQPEICISNKISRINEAINEL